MVRGRFRTDMRDRVARAEGVGAWLSVQFTTFSAAAAGALPLAHRDARGNEFHGARGGEATRSVIKGATSVSPLFRVAIPGGLLIIERFAAAPIGIVGRGAQLSEVALASQVSLWAMGCEVAARGWRVFANSS